MPSLIIPAQRRLNKFHLPGKDLLKPASSKMVPFLLGLQASGLAPASWSRETHILPCGSVLLSTVGSGTERPGRATWNPG